MSFRDFLTNKFYDFKCFPVFWEKCLFFFPFFTLWTNKQCYNGKKLEIMKNKALCRTLGQVSHLRLAAEINIFAKKHLIDKFFAHRSLAGPDGDYLWYFEVKNDDNSKFKAFSFFLLILLTIKIIFLKNMERKNNQSNWTK